jgi:hypothetical protein
MKERKKKKKLVRVQYSDKKIKKSFKQSRQEEKEI